MGGRRATTRPDNIFTFALMLKILDTVMLLILWTVELARESNY